MYKPAVLAPKTPKAQNVFPVADKKHSNIFDVIVFGLARHQRCTPVVLATNRLREPIDYYTDHAMSLAVVGLLGKEHLI